MTMGCGSFVFPCGFASAQDHGGQAKETGTKGTVGLTELPKPPHQRAKLWPWGNGVSDFKSPLRQSFGRYRPRICEHLPLVI